MFKKTNDTAVLESELRSLQEGQLLTYESMSRSLGRDVRVFCSGNLQTAKNILRKEGYEFVAVKNEGVRRINDSEKLEVTDRDRLRQQRLSKRVLNRLAGVAFEKLDEKLKNKHLTQSALFGATLHFTKSSTEKRLSAKVGHSGVLALGDTLKLFTDGP